jgi:O-antigen/teichoic acid export membrane protein
VADFGLERLVLRDISRKPEKISFYLPRLLSLRLFLSLGAYLLILLLGIVLRQSWTQISFLALFGLFIFPYSFTYLLISFLNAQEKMKYMALAVVATQSLVFILGVTFALLKFPLAVIFLAGVGGQLLVALFFLLKARKWGLPLGWVIDKKFFQKALVQSWAFAFLLILSVFYLRLSLLMVGFLKGDYSTGLYGSSFKFIEAMILVPQSLALALFPLSSRLFSKDKKRLLAIYQKGLGALFLFSLPFALLLGFFPQLIISLAYGAEYLPSAPVMSLLGVSLILFFLNSLPGNIIQNSPKFKKFLPWAVLNSLLALLFCFLLIPRWGIVGAAWAVIGGEVVGLVINNLFVWRFLKK